jgi:hypothetical protein
MQYDHKTTSQRLSDLSTKRSQRVELIQSSLGFIAILAFFYFLAIITTAN